MKKLHISYFQFDIELYAQQIGNNNKKKSNLSIQFANRKKIIRIIIKINLLLYR